MEISTPARSSQLEAYIHTLSNEIAINRKRELLLLLLLLLIDLPAVAVLRKQLATMQKIVDIREGLGAQDDGIMSIENRPQLNEVVYHRIRVTMFTEIGNQQCGEQVVDERVYYSPDVYYLPKNSSSVHSSRQATLDSSGRLAIQLLCVIIFIFTFLYLDSFIKKERQAARKAKAELARFKAQSNEGMRAARLWFTAQADNATRAARTAQAELKAQADEATRAARKAQAELERLKAQIPGECVLCYDAEIDCVCTPCGHELCCLECADHISRCPLCTQDCAFLRVFRSTVKTGRA